MRGPRSIVEVARDRVLCVDTMVFVYHLGASARYADAVAPLFDLWSRDEARAVASTLALTETLVGPLRSGADEAAERASRFLRALPGLRFEPVTPDVAIRAARLRVEHALATPDALHVATAIESGAEAFLTNDRGLAKVGAVEVLILDDFLD